MNDSTSLNNLSDERRAAEFDEDIRDALKAFDIENGSMREDSGYSQQRSTWRSDISAYSSKDPTAARQAQPTGLPFPTGTKVDYLDGSLTIGIVLGQGASGTVTQAIGEADQHIVKFPLLGEEAQLVRERTVFESQKITDIKGAAFLQDVDTIRNPSDGEEALVGISNFVPGNDMTHHLKKTPKSPGEVAGILGGISRTLHDAHRQGVAHMDVKPGNTVMKPDGTPVTVDWGLVQPIGVAKQFAMGTPRFMAPEVATGNYHVSGKADVYSAAMIGVRLATGTNHRSSMYPMAEQIINSQPVDIHLASDELLPVILKRASETDPAKRTSSLDLMTDLAAYPQARQMYDANDMTTVIENLRARSGAANRNTALDATVAKGLLEDLPPTHPRHATIAAIAARSPGLRVDAEGVAEKQPAFATASQESTVIIESARPRR